MPSLAEVEQLLLNLLSADNNIRSAAEKSYDDWRADKNSLLQGLIGVICQSSHSHIRKMGTVLLRKTVVAGDGNEETDTDFLRSDANTQAIVKSSLLQTLRTEPAKDVRKGVADVISFLASSEVPAGKWQELLPFIFECSKGTEAERVSSLQIFSMLSATESIITLFVPYVEVLKQAFQDCMSASMSVSVRMAAVEACAEFIMNVDEAVAPMFKPLLPAMLESLSMSLQQRHDSEEDVRRGLECFIELIERTDKGFFNDCLVPIFHAMHQVAKEKMLEDATRYLGMEFLLTCCEVYGPSLLKRVPDALELIVPLCLEYMTEIEESPDWNMSEEDDNDESVDIGQEGIDRVALAIRGKLLVPVVFRLLPPLLSSPDWRQRYAAVMAISWVGEGCHKTLVPELKNVVNLYAPLFSDPHPMVRFAVCTCAGQMSSDFGNVRFQKKFHDIIIPNLIRLMDDAQNPRVQSISASAVINFCQYASKKVMQPYLDNLLSKLLMLIQQGNTMVQEQAVTAVAAVADSAEDLFVKFYDGFMPLLKQIVLTTDPKYKTLRGKAFETISLIGVAVGKDMFLKDAREVTELFLRAQASINEDTDKTIMFQAGARICKCLGEDFLPFLPHVLPPLFEAAKAKPEVQIFDNDEEIDDDWETVPFMSDKILAIRTSALDDKSVACNILFTYAAELGEHFFPFIQETVNVMAPDVDFRTHEGVRIAVASAFPQLLMCVKLHNEKHGSSPDLLVQMFNHLFPKLFAALQEEQKMATKYCDPSILNVMWEQLTALSQCVENVDRRVLPNEQVQMVLQEMVHLMQFYGAKFTPGEEDEIDETDAELNESYRLVLRGCADVIGKTTKHHADLVFHYMDKLLPLLREMLFSPRHTVQKHVALCIFDDLVEFGKDNSVQLFSVFFEEMLRCCSDSNPEIRQAAVFGVGLCGQFGGAAIAPYVNASLEAISKCIMYPDARSDENVYATENAISAAGKLCQFHSGSLDVNMVLPMWVHQLPVKEDDIESKLVYKQFIHFVKTYPHVIVQNTPERIGKLLEIISECFLNEDLCEPETLVEMKALLVSLQHSVPADVLSCTFEKLNPFQKGALQTYGQEN